MNPIIGIKPTQLVTAAQIAAGVPMLAKLGQLGGYDDPTYGYQEFVYGLAGNTITNSSYVCLEQTGNTWIMASIGNTTPGVAGPGSRVAVAMGAMATGDAGWFQIYGKGRLRISSAAAKGTQLNSTGTGGELDDDATAGSEVINGVVLLTTAPGGSSTSSDAVLNYPSVGRTL